MFAGLLLCVLENLIFTAEAQSSHRFTTIEVVGCAVRTEAG
jgi:hypothetical protein